MNLFVPPWWSSLPLFWAAFPQMISFCSGRIWGIEVEGEVVGAGGWYPLIPLLLEAFPLGNSGKQGVSQPGREGFEGIFQDKCKYVKWNNSFYLHEMISERTSWEYLFGWWEGWNLRWSWENRTWLKSVSYREFPWLNWEVGTFVSLEHWKENNLWLVAIPV